MGNCRKVATEVISSANKPGTVFSKFKKPWDSHENCGIIASYTFICVTFGMYYVQCLMLWLMVQKLLKKKKNTCISAIFFFIVFSYGLYTHYFLAKGIIFFHVRLLSLCSWKAFPRRWEQAPGLSYLRNPGAGQEGLRSSQGLCTCMSTQLFVAKDASVVPLTLFREGLFVPGQIRI